MASEGDMETILRKAIEQEGKFEWLDAAKSYEKALNLEPKSVSRTAETWRKVGSCYRLASRQTGTQEDFRKFRKLAVEAYKSAAELFGKEDHLKKKGKVAQCNAIAAYLTSWLASTAPERRKMLEECCVSGSESLEAYKNAADDQGYAEICNDLLLCHFEKLYVASDWREIRMVAQEGIKCADEAIAVLSRLKNKSELVRAYAVASLQSWYAANISEQKERRKELSQRSVSYSKKALELSREVSNPYCKAMSNWAAAFSTLFFTEEVESSLNYAREMLKQGKTLKDNYLKGIASYVLAFVTNWMMLREEDPDVKKEGHRKIIKYAQDANQYLQLVSNDLFIAQVYSYYAESYSSMARNVEVTSEEKRILLRKAVEIGRKGLEHASRSGSPDATGTNLHALSKALDARARFDLEIGKAEKVELLEEALIHREGYNKIVETVFPSNDWTRGVGKNYEGLIKAELARVETDRDKKIALLKSAASDMEDCLSRCRRWILSRPVPTLIAAFARFEDWFGGILNELYLLTEDKATLTRAIEIYEDATQRFKKVDLSSRVAESYWKMAKGLDLLGKQRKAAEEFENAFAEYKNAAQKIAHFADFYLDYATYMKAWSEIERAKDAHLHEKYLSAMERYEKTANLLRSSHLWNYLSSNFSAWSLLEQAEDWSRKESNVESIGAFKKAAELFKEAKEAFDRQIEKIQNLDEKEKAIELSKASILRKDYCLARSNVEEAKIYDRKGDHVESAEKYDSAATIFDKILKAMGTGIDRKEIRAFAFMYRAWQKMKMADGRASPELYRESSELFLKAKEHSTKNKTVLLASGNSAFCKALEHGTMFEEKREKDDFSKAKKFLESAANYYLKAGFENASIWTSATGILFDAYNYKSSAEIEIDPEKKMKIYLLAEKCLERSAGLYETAGHTGKKSEVLKILREVKEKSEFALSLRELVGVPSEASSTSIMSAPGLTVEEPVGLLKFERAFIQANLIAHKLEVAVGETFGLEIQLANLGKNAAFLIKMEEIVPEGFNLIERPKRCVVNDGILNLKGRKLAALATEEMRLTLKPKRKGRFTFTPKIQYMDEVGEHKSCQLEQVTVTVKELGIRGWLRGPG